MDHYWFQFFLLSVFTVKPVKAMALRKPAPLQQPESFCREDYLVALNESSANNSHNRVLSSNAVASGVLQLSTGKVNRQELFRFEAQDLLNEQWAIRTWDGKHLSVNEYGQLTVKSGCVTTTFLRVVLPENLSNCSNGETCKMLFCATSSSNGNTFMVLPGGRGKGLRQNQCVSHKTFTDFKSLEQLKNSGFDPETYSFTLLTANTDKARNMMSIGLKRMCPRTFDPSGEARCDLCVQSTQS